MNQEHDTDAELLALRAESKRGPGSAIERRVLARFEASLLGAAPVERAPNSPVEHAANSPVGSPISGLARPLLVLSAFALGGASGVTAYALLQREPAPRLVFIERPGSSAASVEVPVLAPPSTVVASAASPAAEPKRRHRARPAASAGELINPTPEFPREPELLPANLAEEQKLLDAARAALGSGDFARALSLTEAHRARYAKSQLEEEREALVIKALAGAQRGAEAEERFTRFVSEFPRSPLLPSLRRTLARTP